MAQNWHKNLPLAGHIKGFTFELNIRADRHVPVQQQIPTDQGISLS